MSSRTRATSRQAEATGQPDTWGVKIGALAVGAVLLRLALLLGRGDYLAFDEGWYLLLARSLYTGEGYSLIGIPHVALSPLFPLLAGAAGTVLDSWVWGGRIVAAVASGLLVVPVWATSRHLGSERIAFTTALLVGVLPSMAPFVVPFWIGADLWVGAEPLLHLMLFTGIALWVRADRSDRLVDWALAGVSFGMAFLARPEAILTWGILGLLALWTAARRRSARRLTGAVLMGVGFALVAAPLWIYVYDVTGRWSVTGRAVAPAASLAGGASGSGRGGPAADIERMLWGDDTGYEQRLYGLDGTGLRLRSEYWGVHPDEGSAGPREEQSLPGGPTGAAGEAIESEAGTGLDVQASVHPSTFSLYLRALRQIAPLLLWPLVILGLLRPRRPGTVRLELMVGGALLATSLAIALLVAVDPRTQLFLVPLLAFYAARGIRLLEEVVQERGAAAELRRGFVEGLLVSVAVVWLLGINAQRLYRSLTLGSPHHVVAEQNRAVASELDRLAPGADGPVSSWHPAIAVYADRDWRVLPYASLTEILRYADAAGAAVLVLSAYYPPPLAVENLGTRYLVLPVPERVPGVPRWHLRIERGDSIRAVGTLEPDGETRP